jgi:hypothetical protein
MATRQLLGAVHVIRQILNGQSILITLWWFALDSAIRTVVENQVALELNGTHQMLVYADDVNLRCDSVDTIKKKTQTWVDTCKKVGLEVNTEKAMYMLLPRHQNAGQNHDIKIVNRCFENVSQFRYLGTTVTRFRRKWGGDWTAVIVATIQSRTFCPRVCCLKT